MADQRKKSGKGRKKPLPIPPEKRGRRGQKAVDTQPGLREWLIEQLQQVPRPTLAELVEASKTTGFSIGRTAIWDFRVSWETTLAERDLALRQAQEYAAIGEEEPLKIEAAIATLGGVAILNDVREELKLSAGAVTEKVQNLLNLASRMQTSASLRERTKNHIDRSTNRAVTKLLADIVAELKEDPESQKRVLAAIRNVRKKREAQA